MKNEVEDDGLLIQETITKKEIYVFRIKVSRQWRFLLSAAVCFWQ